ncbi:MAG: HEAT repeat domain-containing protein [Thermodesulfobacteriota bacterium]
MKEVFYHLDYPSDTPHQVYGRTEWQRRFGTGSWSDKVGGLSTGRLVPPYGETRVDLTIMLPSPKIGDFVWTWASDCIVTDRTLSLFTQASFTGFKARPVTVDKIKRVSKKRREKLTIPPLSELLIQGKGGDAAAESGIYPLYEIEDSGGLQYSSFRNGIIVDESNWDGSDFFTANGYHKYILVTERVKECIIGHQLTNCALIPSHKLEWGSGVRPEESLEETRTLAGRPLESLLADLEASEKPMDMIHALAHKGDPRAVDPLIRKFDHPDPFIWNPAADAVVSIARHKQTPEEIRQEIFSKLEGLLHDENPQVRKSAATAFGFIGGDRAAEELVELFEDPDESVRSTSVFMIGHLCYKPALEGVRRLTRDRSKTVREMARTVVLELSCECS